jgi:DNA-binding MarR family transcriptional regulator
VTLWHRPVVEFTAWVVTGAGVLGRAVSMRLVASPMTLLQLTVLHLISALGPVTLTDLAQVLGIRPPATSAMVVRLTHAGLVCSAPDRQDRRRVQLTVTADAQRIIGDTDPATARRLLVVLTVSAWRPAVV